MWAPEVHDLNVTQHLDLHSLSYSHDNSHHLVFAQLPDFLGVMQMQVNLQSLEARRTAICRAHFWPLSFFPLEPWEELKWKWKG